MSQQDQGQQSAGRGHAPESVTSSGRGSVDGAPNTTSSTSGVAEGVTGPEWVQEHGTPGERTERERGTDRE